MRLSATQQPATSNIDNHTSSERVAVDVDTETCPAPSNAAFQDLPRLTTRVGGGEPGSSVQRPRADIGRLTARQAESTADMKAAALEREAELAGQRPAESLPAALRPLVRDVAQQLADQCAVSPEIGKPQQPVAGAWRYFRAIDTIRPRLSTEQLTEVRNEVRAALAQSRHSQLDLDLMHSVIDEITRPGGQALTHFMKERAFTGLCLPQLSMIEEGEKEPNSRVFNSVLPNLAESTFDHNPMGRTLLWEGASRLFAGPREAKRRDALRQVIFTFPNVTEVGQPRLETPWDFIQAVDELGLDEAVDLHALQQR